MIAHKESSSPQESVLLEVADVTPIVTRLYRSLYLFAVRLTKSESDAADLVQQTFLALIQHLHRVRDFSKIKSWLYTTLRRNFLREVRQQIKHREVELLPDLHALSTEDPDRWSSVDGLTVRRALLQIDQPSRTALELFYIADFSYKEIARALGVPIGTVMSRLSRGKTQLKSLLSRSIYADD
jgi:RNA polymerase sigma factor (sigma-70 family)